MLAESWWDANSGFVGLLGLAVAVLTVGLWVWDKWRGKRTKFAEWSILADQSLGAAIPGLEVNMNDTTLALPHAITIRLRNGGKETIKVNDFDGPVVLRPHHAKIIWAGVPETSPNVKNADVTWNDMTVSVEPLMLNRREWLDVQLLVDVDPVSRAGSPTKDVMVDAEGKFADETRSIQLTDPFRFDSGPSTLLVMVESVVIAIIGAVGLLITAIIAKH
jgi:hypothetical protein